MTPASPRVYELRGPDAAAALDWLHVHADVQGALEGDDALTVWLAGPLPALPFGGVAVRELAADPQAAAITGLEADRPIVVADDLLVRPPWVERPADFVGVELVVPRGGAFGSGEHGSTQAALRCLHAMWDAPPTFADVGTGSGILALYA
ncbi:MAG: 50S ribosomal protein L11 methyltransferase, partial [Planctomycetota bacterium]